MKLLGLSGGSTKAAGLWGVIESLHSNGYRPDIIGGVSSGSILAVPAVMIDEPGLREKVALFTTNVKLDDFWDIKPFSLKGLGRGLVGHNSLGVQNIPRILSQIIDEEMYQRFRESGKEVLILAVNGDTAKRTIWSTNDLCYEKYLNAVAASSSIAIATEPIEIDGYYYYDGGFRDHNPANHILDIRDNITDCISVYSRPSDDTKPKPGWHKTAWYPFGGLIKVSSRMIDLFNVATSAEDEEREIEICSRKEIRLQQFFLPRVLNSLYDTNPERLNKLYALGKQLGNEFKQEFNSKGSN